MASNYTLNSYKQTKMLLFKQTNEETHLQSQDDSNNSITPTDLNYSLIRAAAEQLTCERKH